MFLVKSLIFGCIEAVDGIGIGSKSDIGIDNKPNLGIGIDSKLGIDPSLLYT